MSTSFWRSVGRRGPFSSRHYPDVTIREIEFWHPHSVYCSLLNRVNWISKLQLSPLAKRLTRLRGPAFKVAAQNVLDSNIGLNSGQKDGTGTLRQARPAVSAGYANHRTIKSDIQPSTAKA